jgi:hypothetical protein
MSVESDALVQYEQIHGVENRLQAGRSVPISYPSRASVSGVGAEPGTEPVGLPTAVNGEWHTTATAGDNRNEGHPDLSGRPDNRG